jgi:hypothetical protein
MPESSFRDDVRLRSPMTNVIKTAARVGGDVAVAHAERAQHPLGLAVCMRAVGQRRFAPPIGTKTRAMNPDVMA